MNVLVVYAHPYNKSYNAGILDALLNRLKDEGHDVRLRDLYADGPYNPVLGSEDLVAFRSGDFPDDVKAEHEHLTWADRWIFVAPIWWAGFPAIMKGWMDKSFSYNFAYKVTEKGLEQLMTNKRVMIVNTAGTPIEYYAETWKAIAVTQKAMLNFFGAQVDLQLQFSAPASATADERAAFIQEVSAAASSWLS